MRKITRATRPEAQGPFPGVGGALRSNTPAAGFEHPTRYERATLLRRGIEAPLPGSAHPPTGVGRGLLQPVAPSPDATATTKPSPVESAFDSIRAPLVRGDVRLLDDNVEAWASMWRILSSGPRGASYYIMHRDVFGKAFLGAFLREARAGRDVQLLLDAQGDIFGVDGFTLQVTGQDYLQELVETGHAKVQVYHPLHKKALRGFARAAAKFGSIANNHDKILYSGELAQSGGRNVARRYFQSPLDNPDVDRDSDIVVRGKAAVAEFEKALEAEATEGHVHFEVPKNRLGNWLRRDGELVATYHLMDAWMNARPPLPAGFSAEAKAELRQGRGASAELVEKLVQIGLDGAMAEGLPRPHAWARHKLRKSAAQLVRCPELLGASQRINLDAGVSAGVELKVVDRTSAAVNKVNDIGEALVRLAVRAEHRIVIRNAYVALTENAIRALEAASKRGVQIYIETNGPNSGNSKVIQGCFLDDWARLVARIPTLRIFVVDGKQKLHAKSIAIDGRIAAVTSYNLDLLSEQINGEIATIVKSKEIARGIERSFFEDRRDPAQRLVEYTIVRDNLGRPVLRDGEPVVEFGPEHHLSPGRWLMYRAVRGLMRQVRKIPKLASMRRPDLSLPPP